MQFRLVIEYDGADFCGWQIQPAARTVQATIESALETLLGHPVRVSAAGRTDAGVHAAAQVVCFHTEKPIETATVVRALNAITPPDISVVAADVVPESFDPRRSARGRVYVYRIWNRAVPSPFWRRYAWHIARPLAVEAMDEAASCLLGEHDFEAFRAAGCDAATSVRCVIASTVAREEALVSYRIEATAFLRHMVRNIVGTLVEVGHGRRAAADVDTLLASRDRGAAGMTAPAHGLCLVEVKY
jgi:tRNA pseudouridine38-40 synthase